VRISADTLDGMKAALARLRDRTRSDAAYFGTVYAATFDYVRTQGARSLALDTALPFWAVLLPHGPLGAGWCARYTELWFEFLEQKGGRGVSKDTWTMVRGAVLCCLRGVECAERIHVQFLEFARTVERGFANYDEEGACARPAPLWRR
jgi:DCN1-like protein 1/2